MQTQIVTVNKKVAHNFDILEVYESGIELKGTEVKSIRSGKIDIKDAFCIIDQKNEVWLINCRIPIYEKTAHYKLDIDRKRKLLLHKKEIVRIKEKILQKGLVLKPTKVYFSENGWVKLELALCKYKKAYDRREEIKQKEVLRNLQKIKKGKL